MQRSGLAVLKRMLVTEARARISIDLFMEDLWLVTRQARHDKRKGSDIRGPPSKKSKSQ